VETVSRVLSRFQKLGVLSVDNKEINIIDAELLRSVADGSEPT
jgi:CRP/FNR family transcriptional regulator